MAGRAAPTARRTRLGAELRKLRERAGMTTTQAADLLGTSSGQLSNIEVARFGVSADRVRVAAHTYSCTDQALVEALVSMTTDRKRGWWEEYREILPPKLLDLAEIEHHGTSLHAAHSIHIPGLLQTVDHAREIYRQAVPELSPPEIEHRVSYRIKRQAVLHRSNPSPYRAVIHEAALHMRFGGAEVTGGQLQHLLKVSELPHTSIRVIPFEATYYPGSGQSLYYVHGPVPALDTAQLDQSHGPVFIDAEAQLSQYRLLLERLEAASLNVVKSQDLIHRVAKGL
ncbi:Scr1 family TA system antitoxin-like transcriptional regulator [Streptomyces poriferorum]|uniref:Scr1 family TA system antitoxin-like transcriptional regulator n=1 Tax=Streptomyces poriferorum TaxID=2798799 RepID=A0ABY9J6X3_9ACTN|nr:MULTISPECIES: Scr1 family TA system antitoxin-like transcriptional regulator [Streptomyces]WSQ44897.1 Scr1 family TA system antitoxin-like transcriptional regulator [Streptomyces sp. NBC_01220]MBW5253629.1 helix-turn-helix domain-containing protein [Streptomyces poriferorum]MBW5261200.1 helix-turn-helix domain-containing protein [Streptomyces poriferorum]MDP5313531.1 Scr1 family TA system antitoxin-like transcriptional regulator [Streptomyces sp. Alt4]WLQ53416.1 Scr1 family TA system antito